MFHGPPITRAFVRSLTPTGLDITEGELTEEIRELTKQRGMIRKERGDRIRRYTGMNAGLMRKAERAEIWERIRHMRI